MECPVCGKTYQPKTYVRSKGGTSRGKTSKTCSRRCGAALRFKDREAAFWSRIDQTGGPRACWPWTGSLHHTGRYGQVGWKNRVVAAHRIAFELANGHIVPELDVLHRCDNPPCCNPAHLFQGTHDDNMKDMASKGRSGDHRGRNNGRAKVTEGDVRNIRRAYADGETQAVLADRYGLYPATVSQIVRRNNWKHVTDEESIP